MIYRPRRGWGCVTFMVLTLVLLIGGAFVVDALPFGLFTSNTALAHGVCEQGGDWSSHQNPPLQQVQGAVEYCVKGGSDQSACDGYLETGSFEHVSNVVNDDDACALSHWSYRLGEPTRTPKPPTDTPTVKPSDTPKPSSTPVTPTNTVEPSDTPTDKPTDTPPPPTDTPPPPTETRPPPTDTPKPKTPTPTQKVKTPVPTPTATVKVKTPTPSLTATLTPTYGCDWYFAKLVCVTAEACCQPICCQPVCCGGQPEVVVELQGPFFNDFYNELTLDPDTESHLWSMFDAVAGAIGQDTVHTVTALQAIEQDLDELKIVILFAGAFIGLGLVAVGYAVFTKGR